MLKNYLDAAARGFGGYAELRAQVNTQRVVAFLNGTLINNVVAAAGGVNARVCKNGAYGFASSPEYNPDSVAAVLAAAADNAAFLDSKVKIGAKPFSPVAPAIIPCNYPKDDATANKQLIDYLAELDAHIAKAYPDLVSRYLALPCLTMEKLVATTDGVLCHTITPRTSLMIMLNRMGSDGAPLEVFDIKGDFGYFGDLFNRPSDVFERVETLYEHLRKKCEGVYAEAGVRTCIIGHDTAGILAHEAVGHTVEADFVLSGSVGGPNLNKPVASELVSLCDFANEAFGKRLPVPIYYDDEGTKAVDAMLIENGILKGYMHSKESAEAFGAQPTGNARAFAFSDEPLIRMRNTTILPGRSKLEDMIASVDDGYYFMQSNNGQADATGEFMFGITVGYEIKNGKLARAIRDTTISGVAFDMLKTVDMVSDEHRWSSGGMCGKKQLIPVAMGGAALRCKVNVGGR